MFASFGSASGPVEAFNLGLLGQKGSLFATRPTLFTFLADRARLETMAKELFEVVGAGRRQGRHLRPRAARGGGARASRPRGAAHHRLDRADSLTLTLGVERAALYRAAVAPPVERAHERTEFDEVSRQFRLRLA